VEEEKKEEEKVGRRRQKKIRENGRRVGEREEKYRYNPRIWREKG
jgi:hypothetical protein